MYGKISGGTAAASARFRRPRIGCRARRPGHPPPHRPAHPPPRGSPPGDDATRPVVVEPVVDLRVAPVQEPPREQHRPHAEEVDGAGEVGVGAQHEQLARGRDADDARQDRDDQRGEAPRRAGGDEGGRPAPRAAREAPEHDHPSDHVERRQQAPGDERDELEVGPLVGEDEHHSDGQHDRERHEVHDAPGVPHGHRDDPGRGLRHARLPRRAPRSATRRSYRVPLWCTVVGPIGQRRADAACGCRERMPRVRHAGGMPASATSPSPEALAALGVLADRVRRRHAASAGRIVLGITGSPGAGKTTLARSLVGALNDRAAADADRAPRPASRRPGRRPPARRAPADGRLPPRERDPRPARPAAAQGRDRDVRRMGLRRAARAGPARGRPHRVRAGVRAGGRRAGRRGHRDRGIRARRGRRGQLPARRCRAVAAGARAARRVVVLRRRRRRADVAAGAPPHEFGRSPEAARAWATEVDGANARGIPPSRERADLVVSGVTWAVVADRGVPERRLRRRTPRRRAERRLSPPCGPSRTGRP